MAKKSFRVQETKVPSYPRLVELQPGALQRWGLAAIGGLLIGGGACKRQELSGAIAVARTDVERGVRLHAGSVDSGAPTPLPPPGEPPAARVEPAAGDETGKTPDAADPKKVTKRRPPPRLPGGKPKNRLEKSKNPFDE